MVTYSKIIKNIQNYEKIIKLKKTFKIIKNN